MTWEPLVAISNTGNLMPKLAERWESNADKTVWTFTLKKGCDSMMAYRLMRRRYWLISNATATWDTALPRFTGSPSNGSIQV